MKVKDVIIATCKMLEKDDIVSKLANDQELSSDESKLVAELLKCFNFVQDEIATEYCPLICSQKFLSTQGEIDIDDLTEDFVYVKSLKDLNGNNIKYKLFGDKIIFNGDDVVIEYCYSPEDALITDDVEVIVSQRVLAYGVLREYYLLEDLSSEASIFEERFKNSLSVFSEKKSVVKLPKRNWL